jgi:AbrB family looped-hinge helix DNA binding protein
MIFEIDHTKSVRAAGSRGRFYGMKTTIDSAGRIVIPMEIRRAVAIKPGMTLDVRTHEGRIEIEPVPLEVNLERRGCLLVAVPQKSVPPLTDGIVEETRRKLQRGRGR